MSRMSVFAKSLLVSLLLFAVLLAGCSGKGGGNGSESGSVDVAGDAPEVQATDTTGGIRGVVVDEAIRPIKGASIEIVGGDTPQTTLTNEGGLFAVSGLKPGTYLLKATHPLYSAQQSTAEVAAGVKDPAPVKILLQRVVFEQPYLEPLKFDGFIVCSANVPIGYSEECGEGAGSPRRTCDVEPDVPCVANPVFPGERIGGQAGNNVEYNYVVNPGIKTSIVEIVWKPTSDAGKGFYVHVDSDWACDPFCEGHPLVKDKETPSCNCLDGPSPLIGRIDEAVLLDPKNNITLGQSPITVFTWASRSTSPTPAPATVGLLLNQAYQVFVSNFYHVPAPADWSFVEGDEDPFK